MASTMGPGRTQPMTDFHKKVLNRARADIVATMTAKNLLNRLISDDILEIDERLRVLGGTGPSEQNDNLMDIIHWKPDRAYGCFKQALRSVGQDHVADLIEEKEVQLQTELQKRDSKMLSACSKTGSMCCDESRHGIENGLTSVVQNCTKALTTLALPGSVEVNQTRVLAILAEDKVTTSLQKTSTSELQSNPGQLAICANPESPHITDGIVLENEKAVALLGSIENDENGLTKKLEERRRRKRTESKEGNRHPQTGEASGGCTVGIKLSVGEVRIDGDQPGSKDLLRETANYIWRTLSHVVRKPKCDKASESVSPRDQTGIYEFLRSFESKYCQVKHVGLEPVLFVVHCMNLEALETIASLDKEETFATLLEDAVLEGTLAEQHHIKDVTLVTDISKQEINLCRRVLGNLEKSLKIIVQTTPEPVREIEYELCQRTRNLTEGSEIATATRARIIQVEHSSILLTLQFLSLEDLRAFREDLDTGQLTRLIEDVLITDDIKEKYNSDNLGLSVTLVNPWEYEMCETELSLTDERTEDLTDDNLDERIKSEAEGVEQDYCIEAKRRRLEESNRTLSEKAEELEREETKKEPDRYHHFYEEVEKHERKETKKEPSRYPHFLEEVEKPERKATEKADLSQLQLYRQTIHPPIRVNRKKQSGGDFSLSMNVDDAEASLGATATSNYRAIWSPHFADMPCDSLARTSFSPTCDDSLAHTSFSPTCDDSLAHTSFSPTVDNLAHGLAWSYFYGFLNLVLPELAQRVATSEWATKEDYKKSPILPKLLIMLPMSCFCPESLISLDKTHFSLAGQIAYTATRVGNISRDYKSIIYKVRCPDTDKEYLFLAEFPTPLLVLYEMEQESISDLNEKQKHHQRNLFTEKLKQILNHPNNSRCHNKALIMPFNDDPQLPGKKNLARRLVSMIKIEQELLRIGR